MQKINLLTKTRAPLKGIAFSSPEAPRFALSIVHGLGEHGRRYHPMAEGLSQAGIACVSVDLPGHGQTRIVQKGKKGVCPDFDLMIDAVDAVIAKTKELYPDVPQLLLGHSMGGGIVLHYGLKRGTDGLAGVIAQAPLLRPKKPVPGAMLKILSGIRKIAPNFTAKNGLNSSDISSLQDEVDKYDGDSLVHDRLGAGLAVDMLRAGEWSLDQANKWTTPLLMLHASGDKITDATATEKFAAAANCTVKIFDHDFHEIHNDTTREQVYTEIVNFANSVGEN